MPQTSNLEIVIRFFRTSYFVVGQGRDSLRQRWMEIRYNPMTQDLARVLTRHAKRETCFAGRQDSNLP